MHVYIFHAIYITSLLAELIAFSFSIGAIFYVAVKYKKIPCLCVVLAVVNGLLVLFTILIYYLSV